MPGRNGGTLNAGGTPGNRGGRPAGAFSVTRHFREALAANGAPLAHELAEALIDRAKKGNAATIREILNRVDGSVTQRIGLDILPNLDSLSNDEIMDLMRLVDKAGGTAGV